MVFQNPNERKAYFSKQEKTNQPLSELPRLPVINNPMSSQKSQGMISALKMARNKMGGK